ncbi:hypothetical protein [Yinghuangia soli]|uniref:Uncharacterized protein n=1 Tax=Yinghuangia soli TaxID=2908204 RepID=A0AA41Q4S3_9ACTN|nr:hypothetical protein [Yinghuangia soli]MCF2531544.1 hypothetical protein [Yinghuangia soli]
MTSSDTTPDKAAGPSAWQRRIAGEWHGRPSLFDAEGTWAGYEDIKRSSVYRDGATTYYMDGGLEGGGPLAGRFRLGAPFAFGVADADTDRIYEGPDFHGSGQPYGSFVDARYYGPGWQVGLNTWNQVLDDGMTQVYSSVLYEGWAVVGCFNGLYTRTTEPELDAEASARVAELLAAETRCGPVPFVLPTKERGTYAGRCELWTADQKPAGTVEVAVELQPVDLLRTRHHVTWSGALEREFTVERRRDGNRSFLEGPDAWGSARAFGRANFPVWHLAGEAVEVKGREFAVDAAPGMNAGRQLAVVYELSAGNRLESVLHGTLTWQPAA